ncbi:hypothetical protein CKAN_00872800 [Cinnamomum micranthum f. kanehirae]|uniref:Uncharacterized protein n=1 Tax=Cinnamomum micranthum f. kanehirae TaxID=337451 RepID=A0A443NNH6_9MAGN|nr:hypothetical protein CKAN_00872800 [Cinnamomum micranthum f. kanehirae]
MASLLFNVFSSAALFSLGLYNLLLSFRSHLKSPSSFAAKPYHPFSSSSSTTPPSRLKQHLPLYLIIFSLTISIIHEAFLSSASDPLVKGRTPVHRLSSLQSLASLLLFLLLSLSLLLHHTTSLLPLPHDLSFALLSASFFLRSFVSASASSLQTSNLQAKCDSISARISAASAALSLALSFNPRLFVADAALSASLCLQGLWVLQTGLSLYVEGFIPDGCHQLLDVVRGVEGSTMCELEESKVRAGALLDLMFVFHVMFVVVVVVVVYAVVARVVGARKLGGAYEPLPTSVGAVDVNHVQMKAMTNTQA